MCFILLRSLILECFWTLRARSSANDVICGKSGDGPHLLMRWHRWAADNQANLFFSLSLLPYASGQVEGGAKCVIKKIVKRAVRRKSVYNSDCKVLVLLLNQMNVFLNSMLHWEDPRFESRWGTFFTGCLSDFFYLTSNSSVQWRGKIYCFCFLSVYFARFLVFSSWKVI